MLRGGLTGFEPSSLFCYSVLAYMLLGPKAYEV